VAGVRLPQGAAGFGQGPLLLPPLYYFAERAVSFISNRLRRLEERAGCPECRHKPQAIHVYYPDKGEPGPEVEHCPSCGRSLGVILRVVYDAVEGEGA
jgi:hypothetical protein